MEFGNVVNLMNSELLATCNALGYLEGDTYQKEPEALETVKDLIRFLRREDDTCEIRRQLGNAQILQNDLIYLIKQFHKQTELFETCIRLLVNLSQPAELCFGNKIPEDKTTRNYFLEVLSHLQAYKQAFADEEFMVVLAKKLKKLLDMEWESRREDHTMLMERLLLLVRNILHVPADPLQEKRTDDDASVHDQVLWALNVSGMDKLILYVASSEEEQQWCMHAIEITSLMLREQTPEQLAKAGITRATSEKKKDEEELEMARQRELAEKKARALKGSARHPRFGGTFYVKNLKSISDRDIIYHRAPQDAKQMSFDREKNPKKRAKNRMPMKDTTLTRRSTLSIRLFLKEFCELFLDNCYNPVMHAVKDHILHQKAQENDDTYYLWAMRFFMEFSRHYHFRVDVISETFSVQAFYYVQTHITKYLDMMITDKKESGPWSKRLHYALKAYRELLATLNTMAQSKDRKIRDSARVLQSNIFYVIEYREIFVMLLKKFDDVRNTKSFLVDLIESTHIFLKMLENYCKGKNTILVQKKGRKKNKRRQRNRQNNQQAQEGPSEEVLNDKWDQVTSDLSAMLQGNEDIPENVVPFDAASEQPVEEQRMDAMVRIQRSLHNAQPGDSVALLRAAREVWPEGDIFGANDISPEEEFMALREIHFTNLNVAPPPVVEPEEPEMEEDEEDEMAAMEREVRGEEEFNFTLYADKFAHPDVIRCYVSVLKDYRKNTVFTNHCAVKMLHRIGFDQGDSPLLFQLSLFRVFQKVLNDPVSKLNQYKEIAKFAKYVVSKFFEMAAKNSKMFVEILFWKSKQDLYELQEGYGAVRRKGPAKVEWLEEESEELRQLYNEYKNVDTEEDEMDVVDRIMEHIIDNTRTRKQIINQLVELGLAMSVADFKRKKPGYKASLWREEQELELKTLYDQYKDSDDPLGDIISNLSDKRSKVRVVNKLLSMGLVEQRSQLYKKRRKKEGAGRGRKKRNQEEDDIRDFMSEDEDGDFNFEDAGAEDGGNVESEPEAEETESSDGEDDEEVEGVSLGSLVAKLTKKGFTEQIKWIQDGLRTTADDREADGDDQSIPLVPLSEENESAMDNKLFKQFLKKVGIAPPATHEELFWRIPGHLTPQDLRSAADYLQPKAKDAMNQDSESEDADRETKKMENPRYKALKEMAANRKKEREEGTDRDKRKNNRKKRPARMEKEEALRCIQDEEKSSGDELTIDEGEEDSGKENGRVESGDSSGEDGGGRGMSQSGQRSAGKAKRALQSDSSSSEDDEFSLRTLARKTKDKSKKASNPPKRSRLMSSDDDSSEDERDQDSMDISHDNQQDSQSSVTNQPSQNGSLQSSTKSTKPSSLQSDSESDDDLPLSTKKMPSKPKSDSDSDSDIDDPPRMKKSSSGKSKASKKISAVESDSDSDDDLPLTNKSSTKQSATKKTSSKPKSDSDSESDIDDRPQMRKSSSGKSNPGKKVYGLESDSDSDDDLPLTSKSSAKQSAPKKAPSKPKSDSDSVSDDDLPLTSKSSAKQSSTKKAPSKPKSDSDSDSNDDLPLTNKSSAKQSASKKTTSKLDSDSDSDDDDLPVLKKSSSAKPRATNSDTDSDEDLPLSKTNSTIQQNNSGTNDVEMSEVNGSQEESESDSDDDLPLRKVARRHILESDSDDD